MRSALLIIVIAIASGCTQSTEPKEKQHEKQSTVTTAINGITGKTAVDAGKRARNQIEAISAKHDAELSEVMGE